jgi:hypothetical protein
MGFMGAKQTRNSTLHIFDIGSGTLSTFLANSYPGKYAGA